MVRLDGKVCVVTGASRGLGRGIALQLANAGATVYITGELSYLCICYRKLEIDLHILARLEIDFFRGLILLCVVDFYFIFKFSK